MNNPILNSEQFSNAVYSFRDFCQRFDQSVDSLSYSADSIKQSVQNFTDSVNKLAIIQGMIATNMERQHRGEVPAYNETAFHNL